MPLFTDPLRPNGLPLPAIPKPIQQTRTEFPYLTCRQRILYSDITCTANDCIAVPIAARCIACAPMCGPARYWRSGRIHYERPRQAATLVALPQVARTGRRAWPWLPSIASPVVDMVRYFHSATRIICLPSSPTTMGSARSTFPIIGKQTANSVTPRCRATAIRFSAASGTVPAT